MKEFKKRILITSALIYANGPVHIGNLVENIQTDIYVRFLRLRGHDAFYCGADDTHGAPIEINAMKQGITPEQFIGQWWKEHVEDYKLYNIGYDSYYTTHSPENQYYTELIFKRLQDAGHIYTKEIDLTYCEHCRRYLPDRYVKGTCPKCGAKDQYGDVCEKCNATYSTTDLVDPYCSICGNKPIRKPSRHYFFRLNDFSEKLRAWLIGNRNLQPEIRNQILAWVDQGLQDWCISRDGPYFGFKIPGEDDKYFYVWLDAPIGYIASTAHYCRGKTFTADDIWQKENSTIIHVIGKDIIAFHLLFWPAVLMGSGFHVPDNIVVHGFLNVNGEKMSKSRGTFLTAREFSELINPELLRYYYAANLGHSMTDIDLDLKTLQDKVNNELVSNIANLVYRTLSFLDKNFDSTVTTILNKELLSDVARKTEVVRDSYYDYNFREAVAKTLEISTLGNKYFQDNQPWELVKTDREKAQRVLTDCVNIVKTVTILLQPILPVFSSRVEEQLNLTSLKWTDLDRVIENHRIDGAKIVLRKIEPIVLRKHEEKKVEPRSEAKMEEKPKKPSGSASLDLRIAVVKEVHDHPQADKLYILKIDLGSEQRQLCAGLKPYYTREELLGKHLVVVTNLKPAKLRGELSQGMLLAADSGNVVGILNAPDSPPGTQVTAEAISGRDAPQIEIGDVAALRLESKTGKAYVNGKLLRTDYETVQVDKGIEGRIR
jgi:methionyl-tRNA synthetase